MENQQQSPWTDMTPQINELAAALAKAQGDISGASKDRINPHFKQAYATLDSVWEACREPLSKNGLAVSQLVSASGPEVRVETILMHSSGQFIRSSLTVTARGEGAQDLGSAITYGRRYGLSAIVGVAPSDDDDGNAAQGRRGEPPPGQHQQQRTVPEPDEGLKEAIAGYKDRLDKVSSEAELASVAAQINSEPEAVRDAMREPYRIARERVKPTAKNREKKKAADSKATGDLVGMSDDLGGQNHEAGRVPGEEG